MLSPANQNSTTNKPKARREVSELLGAHVWAAAADIKHRRRLQVSHKAAHNHPAKPREMAGHTNSPHDSPQTDEPPPCWRGGMLGGPHQREGRHHAISCPVLQNAYSQTLSSSLSLLNETGFSESWFIKKNETNPRANPR